MAFWGRINGIGADYLIAQGYKLPYAMVGATSSPAVSFYSTNGTSWMKIADVAGADSARCAGITSPFSGDAGEKTAVLERAKEIGGSGGSLEPPGPLLTHFRTVYMAYSECPPTLLNPLAERTLFLPGAREGGAGRGGRGAGGGGRLDGGAG